MIKPPVLLKYAKCAQEAPKCAQEAPSREALGSAEEKKLIVPNGQTIDAAEENIHVLVASYTSFGDLAHQPHGTPASSSIRVFHFDAKTGNFVLVFILEDPEVKNVAFIRKHPKRNILYVVTESILEEGKIIAFSFCSITGALSKMCQRGCGGKSTCYITLSYDLRYLFVVNYWDSTLKSICLDPEGRFEGPDRDSILVPGRHIGVKAKRHGDDPHSTHRINETHAHALELDPVFGRVAYVPDLGEDCIKQFVFDRNKGEMQYAGTIEIGSDQLPYNVARSDNKTLPVPSQPGGPRYLKFHQSINVAYLVNELSSTVTVFAFDEDKTSDLKPVADGEIKDSETTKTLRPIQTISTIPQAFCRKRNTCGRVTQDPTGNFVLVSNRGHDSIAVFPVARSHNRGFTGMLQAPQWYHIGGFTPRHFKFDPSGQWLFCANQDSDCIVLFAFDQANGVLSFKSKTFVESPNFIEAFIPCQNRRQDPWVYARL